MKFPLCKEWGVWCGPEIEGNDQIGVKTLFVRDLRGQTIYATLKRAEHYNDAPFDRIWLCKEFISVALRNDLDAVFSVLNRIRIAWPAAKIAIEVDDAVTYGVVTSARKLLEVSRCIDAGDISIFVKIPWVTELAPDYVCVGPAYADMAVKIEGNRVTPLQYDDDVCLDFFELPVEK